MKKIIIIVALIMVSCSDNPTEIETKEYPISHKNIAAELAIKINQQRKLNGIEEYIYSDNAIYKIGEETTVFNEHTGYDNDDFFFIDETYEIQRNDTIAEFITRWRYYYNDTDDLVNKLYESRYFLTERVEGGETTIAINIVERESNVPDKVAIDFYVYFIVRDF